MRIGVIGVQGDVSEHVDAVARAMKDYGKEGEAIAVRRPADLARVDGLTIPGGESTTISKLLVKLGLFNEIRRRATDEGMPIMGTCAGCILLSKDAGSQAEKTKTRLLGLMDMAVDRNACGRQRESFEAERHVERGAKDGHRRVDRRRQPGRGLRSEDPEIGDLARERGHLDLLEVRDRLPDRAFRLREDRLAVEGRADRVETVHRQVDG